MSLACLKCGAPLYRLSKLGKAPRYCPPCREERHRETSRTSNRRRYSKTAPGIADGRKETRTVVLPTYRHGRHEKPVQRPCLGCERDHLILSTRGNRLCETALRRIAEMG